MKNFAHRLLFVGAFPPPEKRIFGGNVTACKTLLDAGLSERLELILLDSTQRSVPPPPAWQRSMDSLPRVWKFVRLLIKSKPDAILIFASTGLSFSEKSFLAVLGRLSKSQVLFFPRGGRLMDVCRQSVLYRAYVRFMMRFPNILLCQGPAWQDFFVNELDIPLEKCIVLTNWTATTALLQIGAAQTYGPKEKLRILFLGWVSRSKGIFELIEAVEQILPRFPNLELCIAGEGEAFDEAHHYVVEKGLEKEVVFLGWIDGESKLQVFSTVDLFCLPSHVEGLPNAMIEAMAAGIPIVVTPVGSIPDVIQDKKNGLLTPVKDSPALAQRIELLLLSPTLREELGRSAYETAAAEFNAAQAVRQLTELVTRYEKD